MAEDLAPYLGTVSEWAINQMANYPETTTCNHTSVGPIEISNPVNFGLFSSYPNPFNPSTTIHFAIDKSGHVVLKIFDLLGHEIATLINENRTAGSYNIQWTADGLPGGIYFARLETQSETKIVKLILQK